MHQGGHGRRADGTRVESNRGSNRRCEGSIGGQPHAWQGILTHAGHTYRVTGRDEILRVFHESNMRMAAMKAELALAGLPGCQVSIGDTPGCTLTESFDEADEIRPGNFVFYDAHQLSIGTCTAEDVAVALACPVVAKHPERSEVVVYGGAIHLSKDLVKVDGQVSYGLPVRWEGKRWRAPLPGGYVRLLSQEHGVVHLSEQILRRWGWASCCILSRRIHA